MTRAFSFSSLLAAVVTMVACAHPPRTDIRPGSVAGWYVSLHSDWERTLPDEEDSAEVAEAQAAQFCANGRFRVITGFLYKSGERLAIGADLGLEYEGTWRATQAGLTIEAELVFALVAPPPGKTYPATLHYEVAAISDEFALGERRFHREPRIAADAQGSFCDRPLQPTSRFEQSPLRGAARAAR